jgi:hypothetical protein
MATVYEDLIAKAVSKGIDPAVAAAAAEQKLAKEGRSIIEMSGEPEEKPVPARKALVQKAVAKGVDPAVAEMAAEQKLDKEAQKAFAKEATKAEPSFGAVAAGARALGADRPEKVGEVLADLTGPRRAPMSQDLLMEQMLPAPSLTVQQMPESAASGPVAAAAASGPSPGVRRAYERFAAEEASREKVGVTGIPNVSVEAMERTPRMRSYESLLPEEKTAVLQARRRADIAKTQADVESTGNLAMLVGGLAALPSVATGAGVGQFLRGAAQATMQTSAAGGGAKGLSGNIRTGLLRPEQEARLVNRPDDPRARDAMDPMNTTAPLSEEEERIRRYGLPELPKKGTLEEQARARLLGSEVDDETVDPRYDKLREFLQFTANQNPKLYVPVGPVGDEYKQLARSPEDALLVNPDAFERWAAGDPSREQRAKEARERVAQMKTSAKTVTVPGIAKPMTRDELITAARSPEAGLRDVPLFLRMALANAPQTRATQYVENPEAFRKEVAQESIRRGVLPSAEFLGLSQDEYGAVAQYGQAKQDDQGNVYLDPNLAASIADLIETRDADKAAFDTVMSALVQGQIGAP